MGLMVLLGCSSLALILKAHIMGCSPGMLGFSSYNRVSLKKLHHYSNICLYLACFIIKFLIAERYLEKCSSISGTERHIILKISLFVCCCLILLCTNIHQRSCAHPFPIAITKYRYYIPSRLEES